MSDLMQKSSDLIRELEEDWRLLRKQRNHAEPLDTIFEWTQNFENHLFVLKGEKRDRINVERDLDLKVIYADGGFLDALLITLNNNDPVRPDGIWGPLWALASQKQHPFDKINEAFAGRKHSFWMTFCLLENMRSRWDRPREVIKIARAATSLFFDKTPLLETERDILAFPMYNCRAFITYEERLDAILFVMYLLLKNKITRDYIFLVDEVEQRSIAFLTGLAEFLRGLKRWRRRIEVLPIGVIISLDSKTKLSAIRLKSKLLARYVQGSSTAWCTRTESFSK